jgi:acetyltransferase-like isoleucine patch superfamily enzyme
MSDAFIDPTARLGEGCILGHHTVVLEGARLGQRVVVGHNVVIHPGTVLHDGVRVGDNSVLGRLPQLAKTSTLRLPSQICPLEVGAWTAIGNGVVLHAGTRIGTDCLIADQSFVREGCTIGDAVIVGRGVTVENGTTIGSCTKIQSQAYITAWTTIEEHVFIAPCVVTTNDNFMGRTAERFRYRKGPTIKRGARVGANTTLLPGITIGCEAFVAAGSLVTRDVADGTLVMGHPAKPVRAVPSREYVDRQ